MVRSVPGTFCVLCHLILRWAYECKYNGYHQHLTDKGRYRAFNLNTQRGRNGRQSRGTRTFLGGGNGSTLALLPVVFQYLLVTFGCEILASKLESIRALLPFLHRGLPLRLFAWFFPIKTKPLLSVLKNRRFTSQGDCKTGDKDNQPCWPGCLSWTL